MTLIAWCEECVTTSGKLNKNKTDEFDFSQKRKFNLMKSIH